MVGVSYSLQSHDVGHNLQFTFVSYDLHSRRSTPQAVMIIRRPHDIGAIVRQARLSRALSQQQLADRLGVSRWWVNEFELGKSKARIDLVLSALNHLGVSLSADTGPAALRGDRDVPVPDAAGPSDHDVIDAIATTGTASPARVRKAARP
jgi:transcriptional regulator with XRE-family HTH domain